ncbi:LabA-like NYN domain-containing protein [Microseira wollei]|uniref:NYN domain-containing protein n=1 Tax=Microseira wollei NIES-4236 TaxID=2530354 RepID=A0AAV3X7U4_9CYAN|nr:NYN domain-containing protein [Microseira wollei]GET37880.1 protein of unknown function DUF88 [Microseira wollei NIES-4236]
MSDKHKLLKTAKQICLFSSVVGAGISAISGQVAYFSVPLSLAVVLMNEDRCRRCDLLQQSQQKNQITAADVEQHFHEIDYQIEQFQKGESQLKPPQQKYLTNTHLRLIISKLHQVQQQQKVMQIGQINKLEQQVKEIQQMLGDLDASTEDLQDRTRNLDQLQQQLAEVQQMLQAEAFSRTIPLSPKVTSSATKSCHRQQHERVAIFVDAANLYYGATSLGININYAQLLSVLQAKSAVCRVFLYTGVEPNNKKQLSFLSWMQRQGYQVISKEVVQRADGSRKANLDVELALHMVELANSYDTAVLVSGDGDFVFPVKIVQSRGKRVEVVSFRSNTSVTLCKAADCFLDLETIPDQIC